MVTHTPLYRELYKFTNEYKENEAKKIINKFIFKQPSVEIADGSNFINSEILYSSKLDIIHNTRVYFDNLSGAKNRYLNKEIRICNIPFSEFGNSKEIIKKLTSYVMSTISIENGEYISSLESLGLRREYWKQNYPDLSSFDPNNNHFSWLNNKWLYGLQFNSVEFYEATGLMVSVNRRKNISSIPASYMINGDYDLPDGKNIRISVQSNAYLEIDFIERSLDTDDIYELILHRNHTSEDSSIYDIISKSVLTNTVEYSDYGLDICLPKEWNSYNIFKELLEIWVLGVKLYDYEYNLVYENDGIHVKINNPTNLITNIDMLLVNIKLQKTEKDSSVLEERDYLGEKGIDAPYYSSKYINDLYIPIDSETAAEYMLAGKTVYIKENNCYYVWNEEKYSDYNGSFYAYVIDDDEQELRDSLPFSLEYLLSNKSTFNIKRVEKILFSNIVFRNNIPCVKYTINTKHDTILFFKGCKLLSPTDIEFEEETYTIYISIENMITKSAFEDLRLMMYGAKQPTTYINLSIDDLWIVYDTDRLFIENMRYDVKSIWKYVNLSKETRYSITTDELDNEIYIEDDAGEYIKYKDTYLELGAINYYLENGVFIPNPPAEYTGDIYNKLKTNEYLLPVNKDIDPTKLVVTIEDLHIHDSMEYRYRRDPEGIYIHLSENRYYVTYDKSYLYDKYIKINGEYILYTDEYIDYTGNFYILKEPGYIIPPYYYAEDIHYTKVGSKCVMLSNVFNLTYSEEIVAVDTFIKEAQENGTEDLVEVKTYTKEELISKLISNKFNISNTNDVYIITSDGDYKLYSSLNKVKNSVGELVYYIFDENGTVITTDSPAIFYKNNDSEYINIDEVDSYKLEISQFIGMNRVYKFTLKNGEILDGGYASSDEYIQTIDSGYATSYSEYPSIDKESALTAIANGDNVYMIINGRPKLYDPELQPNYNGPFYTNFDEIYESNGEIDLNSNFLNGELYTDDDYPVYDFNFSSPYSIIDDQIKAYRIDSSYNNYFLNSEDDFLAYVIPNQLINSENKLMTFLDGKMTDEYIINKNLYSRLFGGDTILSFSNDPDDSTGDSYMYHIDVNGEYYFNPENNTYVHDPNRNKSIMERSSASTYYKSKYEQYEQISAKDLKVLSSDIVVYKYIDNEYIPMTEDEIKNYNSSTNYSIFINIGIIYIDSELYDTNDIISKDKYEKLPDNSYILDNNTGTYYKLKNGKYILVSDYTENTIEIESYQKYFELIMEYNGSFYILAEDYYIYTTPYSKTISTVFMSNLRNLSLYQHNTGITYKDKIFTVNNEIDSILYNERLLYRDIYFPPLSLKYMLFFINGKFANPYIEILTPQRFFIKDNSFLNKGEIIEQIQIYAYDKYLYSLNYYNSYFTKLEKIYTDVEMNDVHEYNVYAYKDNMWDKYGDQLTEYMLSDNSISEQTYEPRDIGYNFTNNLISLYEIFGKYILNKYDIDNDYTLYDEIREYFSELFDEDNRMRLELLQDKTKRKYIY